MMAQFGDGRLMERFWSKCVPEPNSGCWLFVGRADPKGYGEFDLDNTSKRAHRVTYEALVGRVANGLELDHRCRLRCCVNPAHLEAVTHLVNMQRGAHAQKTHCASGHEFTAANTWTYRGSRHCRTCRANRSQQRTPEKRHAEYKRRRARRS